MSVFRILFFTAILLPSALFAQNDTLATATGDLDKDNVPEKVIVLNTGETTDWGKVREIQILKQEAGKWKVWKSSVNAIRKSEQGGMMGDPFAGIEIVKGILLVQHEGGSSWKWNYTDKYRYQNDQFELIGHTTFYGKLCESFSELDYNLSTGSAIATVETFTCEDFEEVDSTKETEEFKYTGIKLNLQNRTLSEHEILTPKNQWAFSL